jgi:putative phage-type endonuclease
MQQGSQEWKQARCGKVTASRVADVIARTKTGYGASRNTYMGELIAERLTGVPAEGYTNGAMQWGIDHEGDAADAYAFYAGVELDTIGFVDHPTIPMAGASPDRLVAADGLIEVKCPNTATHIDTLLSKSVPGKYLTQMYWQMACTGRQWCDFVSFDPRMPESLRLFVRRVQRDDAEIQRLEDEVRTFLAELDGKIIALMGKAA